VESKSQSILSGKKHLYDAVTKGIVLLCAALTVTILAAMLIYILLRGVPQIDWTFLTSQPSALKGVYGILPGIVNTLYIIGITLLIATPVGVGAAIYLSEYAGTSRKMGPLVRFIEFTVETLSGIPSIIYGLFGAVFFGEVLRLDYSILEKGEGLSLLLIRLHTGRTHQIRCQMSHIGHPIAGDRKYGDTEKPYSIALWSYEIRFEHPRTGAKMVFHRAPPEIEPWSEFSWNDPPV